MSQEITSSPLTWPHGWKRTPYPQCSRFGRTGEPLTIAYTVKHVINELKLMGIPDYNIIISTNLQLRNDGLPYSNQSQPNDKGVAIWWKKDKKQLVIAIDRYDKIADNIYAVAKTIEAMRGIKRWGGGEILERTFDGFAALPGPDQIVGNWRDTLEFYGDDIDEAKIAYKRAVSKAHPDNGGTDADYDVVNKAWEQAQKELKS